MLQLSLPFQLAGRVRIRWHCDERATQAGRGGGGGGTPWRLRTSNVRRLRLYALRGGWNASCVPEAGLLVDACHFTQAETAALLSGGELGEHLHLLLSASARGDGCGWQLATGNDDSGGGGGGGGGSSTAAGPVAAPERWPQSGGPARMISAAGESLIVVGTQVCPPPRPHISTPPPPAGLRRGSLCCAVLAHSLAAAQPARATPAARDRRFHRLISTCAHDR
eukprot:COSAG01_NODE_15808_length_1302_cov_2.328881_1_plen_223_part_00